MAYYSPYIHHRRSIRLKGYDYSQAGLYFITICVHHYAWLFGEIRMGEICTGGPCGRPNFRIATHEEYDESSQEKGGQEKGGQEKGGQEKGGHKGRPYSGGGAEMVLNDAGKMIEAEWLRLPERFPNIQLHEFVIMPNHFHAILQIVSQIGPGEKGGHEGRPYGHPLVGAPNVEAAPNAAPKSLGDMIGAFKSITTGQYIQGVKQHRWPPFDGRLWQRNYWEHIIRNEESYLQIAEYIINNPAKWQEDKLYSDPMRKNARHP